MLKIIFRVKRLRRAAREENPKLSILDILYPTDHLKVPASWCLRFMIYVGRDPDGRVLLLGPQHYYMASNLYQTEKGIEVRSADPKTDWLERDKDGHDFRQIPWDGCANIIPPGHSKTNTVAHYVGLRICRNTNLRAIFLHAQSRQAEANLQFVAKMFDPAESSGRRCIALFPHVRIRAKNESKLVLETKESIKQATGRAYGVNAKASGGDADILWEDDVCDKEIGDSDVQRDKVAGQLAQRWRRRLRPKPGGIRPMDIVTATVYHHDDPNMRLVTAAIRRKLNYRVLRIPCGGPDSSPPFRPIWPEMYPASKLRRIYNEMRDPRAYAALYMCNPMPDEMRKVKRLAYWAPDPNHEEFLRSATFYLSIDPTATANEKSDKASFLYGAIGELPCVEQDGTRGVRRVARILEAREFRSTHVQMVPEVVNFCRSNSVHYVLLEVNGNNGYSTYELLDQLGIDVVQCPPRNRAKDKRFEAVAPLLDESLREKGFAGAVVQFPGVLKATGFAGQDEEYRWLYTQVLDFGTIKADHSVDALSQWLEKVRGDLDMSGARASVQAVAAAERGDGRLKKMYDEAIEALREPDGDDVFRYMRERMVG